ncbi:MAG: S-layer homology domain-containing protein [Clostridia bacterium]|nr:S-layer homology domain-containing protein [Clostridia bacterium]
MKKWRIVSVICLLALSCVLLSGCMAEVMNVVIHEDGSGTAKIQVGFTEEALESMKQAQQMTEEEEKELVPFTYNGAEYFGNVEDYTFADLEELNVILQGGEEAEDGDLVMFFAKNEDGSMNMRIRAGQIEADNEQIAQQYMYEMGLDEETATELAESMVMLYEFTFPEPVVQVAGATEGITIDGNVLSITATEMNTSAAGMPDYEFSTAKEPKRVLGVYFEDVKAGDWFAPAVYNMARVGLVQGVGNHLFDPEGILTYAEFCQILARALSMETGEENGYWAAKAIKSCIDAGWMTSLGDIKEEVYDVAISRENAIAVVAEINGGYLLTKADESITEEQIPDFASIAPEYQEKILDAYRVGITQGVDESKTFDPKATLTRAEICQLLYNIAI